MTSCGTGNLEHVLQWQLSSEAQTFVNLGPTQTMLSPLNLVLQQTQSGFSKWVKLQLIVPQQRELVKQQESEGGSHTLSKSIPSDTAEETAPGLKHRVTICMDQRCCRLPPPPASRSSIWPVLLDWMFSRYAPQAQTTGWAGLPCSSLKLP